MKKVFLFIPMFALLFSCKSKEEKIQELIKKEMFATLYDFESYEPIELKVDSAFSTIYRDSTAIAKAALQIESLKRADECLDKLKSAQSSMEIWSDSYSSTGIRNYKKAEAEFDDNMERAKLLLKIAEEAEDSIKVINSSFNNEFIGWKATHKFRCKTKGGNFDLGNYVFIVDDKVTVITDKYDLDDEYTSKINKVIEGSINKE